MNSLITNTENLALVEQRIRAAEKTSGRSNNSVQLIGASKKHSAMTAQHFFAAGLKNFGENYVDEAIAKQSELTHLDITWHFIGPIQSNKTKAIAQNFSWVHSVDRWKIAQRLNQHRASQALPEALNILIQVNLDNEASKHGVSIEELPSLAKAIGELEHLTLRGLMAIPKPQPSFDTQRHSLMRLQTLQTQLNQTLPVHLDTLSAGMSSDLEAAIAAGSTMVRIGTDLFGQRPD